MNTDIETALLSYLKATYLPERFRKSASTLEFTQKDVRFFAAGAAELSEAFTSGRKDLPKNYFNKKEARSAYLLYFTLTNFAKVTKCLQEADRVMSFTPPPPPSPSRGEGKGGGDLKILDLGCGPGTAALACSQFFANRPLSITGVDQNREILKDAKALFSLLGRPHHKFTTIEASLRAPAKQSHGIHGIATPRLPAGLAMTSNRFDLIIAANVLNEMGGPKEQIRLCQTLIDRYLSDTGLLIVVDPALQKTTRALMEVRDCLNAQILSPCLHQGPCPMRAQNRRDWCHFYIEWECPQIIKDVDRLLGIKHNYLKMAYLILTHRSTLPNPPLQREGECLWRVVSSPLRSKGKCEFVLCGKGQLKRIVRFDKDRSDKNKSFDSLKRGDVIKFLNPSESVDQLLHIPWDR